jgi:hypothetical protein
MPAVNTIIRAQALFTNGVRCLFIGKWYPY